jgi:hypothetical protein
MSPPADASSRWGARDSSTARLLRSTRWMCTTFPLRSAGPGHAVGQQGTHRHLALAPHRALHPSTFQPRRERSCSGDGTERVSRVPGTLSPSPQPRGSARSPTRRVRSTPPSSLPHGAPASSRCVAPTGHSACARLTPPTAVPSIVVVQRAPVDTTALLFLSTGPPSVRELMDTETSTWCGKGVLRHAASMRTDVG